MCRTPTGKSAWDRGLRAALVTLLLGSTLLSEPARAQRVLEPGLEKEVLALFEPLELGGEVTPGWTLSNIAILKRSIDCVLKGPNGGRATLTLSLKQGISALLSPGEEQHTESASFDLSHEANSDEASAAVMALSRVLRRNDTGTFLKERVGPVRDGGGTHLLERSLDTQNWPVSDGVKRLLRSILWYVGDSAAASVAGLLLLLCLVFRSLRESTPQRAFVLFGLVIAGAFIRWWMSPEIQLGAWFASRGSFLTQHLWYHGTILQIRDVLGYDFNQVKAIFTVNYLYAAVTPLAVYLHARHLLGSHVHGIVAAAVVVFLPIHIRFSRSEVAFIPSILLSSFMFALAHIALKDRSRLWATFAGLGFTLVTLAVFFARPLNIIFLPLVLVVTWGLLDAKVANKRRILLSAAALLTGLYCVVYGLLTQFGSEVNEGLSVQTVLNGFEVLLSPQSNTLLNPWITSPVFTILALGGAWHAWRSGRKHLCLFLAGWYLLFLFAHAYVVPKAVAMQARYHLHLLIPTAFLAVLGLEGAWQWRRKAAVFAGVLLALSPLMHADFIGDILFNEQQEHVFVEAAVPSIDKDCTVLEYLGDHEHSNRFRLHGQFMTPRGPRQRFVLKDFRRVPRGDPPLGAKTLDLVRNPPECTYYFEGLQCWNGKEREEFIAPECAALRQHMNAEEVASHAYPARGYDQQQNVGVGDKSVIELRLYRLFPSGAPPAQP